MWLHKAKSGVPLVSAERLVMPVAVGCQVIWLYQTFCYFKGSERRLSSVNISTLLRAR